jgi:hypothetical protein
MRYVQAGILAALVIIAGLLFNISSKMGQPAPAATATAAQPVEPAPAITPPAPVLATPAASPARPRPANRRVEPAREVASSIPAPTQSGSYPPPPPPPAPSADTIARPRTSEADYSGPSYPNSVIAPQSNFPPPPPPAAARALTVPAGTPFTVRMLDALDSERNRAGDTFQGSLDEDLQADGVVVARRGSVVYGKIVQARQAGRVAGVAEMALEIERIQTVAGDMPIASDVLQKEAPSSKGQDAAKVGVLAGIGAAIGAIAGGRKGAGIGAGAGATAGTAGVLIERGKPVKINPEDRVTFRLRAPLTVNADPSRTSSPSDPERPALRRRNG